MQFSMDACLDYITHFGKTAPLTLQQQVLNRFVGIFVETLTKQQAQDILDHSSSSAEVELDERCQKSVYLPRALLLMLFQFSTVC